MDDQMHAEWVMVTCVGKQHRMKEQQDEKHESIHCFCCLRCAPERQQLTDTQTNMLSCSFTVVVLFSNKKQCFSDRNMESPASLRSDIILSAADQPQDIQWYPPYRMESSWGEWVGRMKCLNCCRTPMKTSRLWVTLTHYPSAACTGSLCHLFWTRSLSFPPSLRILSLSTSSLTVGLLCDPHGCFSTLFTAADHRTITGI